MAKGNQNGQTPKKKKKKKNIFLVILKKFFMVIATTLLSLFLVMVITGTIVATALTVYVLDFMEDSTSITLQELESGSDTYFYGTETDENGEAQLKVLKKIKVDVQRIPVTIDKIPQHVRNAFVYTEDERFYTHDGVDYKRTFSAFLNMFLHFYNTDQGGSTITQQLIKNLTGDDEHSPQRKIREIFSAMQLEKTYSKDEILEEYLNYIGFGGPINGIQLAATRYFGKSVEELTVPEAAVLAAIPQSPEWYGPFVEYEDDEGRVTRDGKANNKTRQQYVLWQLYKNGAITYDEYQEYLNTDILYTDSEEYKKLHPEIDLEEMEQSQQTYTWEVDAMMYEAAGYLMEQYNIDQEEAIKRINKGGFRIYSTIDEPMQSYVEEKMLDINNIVDEWSVKKWVDLDGDGEAEEQLPHIAFVALRYDGSVMCQVGNLGEKVGALGTSYAVTEPRQIGSTMKPISTYGLALETDYIHWGSVFKDEAIMELDGKPWPTNYSTDSNTSISHAYHNIYYFLEKSFNTVPAQLCRDLTIDKVWEFCTEKMGMKLDEEDKGYSPLSVGSLTWGITLENLVNAYIPYGNQGIYNEAHIVSRIEDANHKVIYSNDGNAREAVSPETAYVMNRLLKNVVENGTGTAARLNNKVVCGKTGTTDNWYDLTFVGLTRDFVSGITIGYKEYNTNLSLPLSLKSAQIWRNIIGDYADTHFTDTPADFDEVPGVVAAPMCTATGLIAGPYCPKGIQGYWKSSNAPVCDGGHYGAMPVDNGNGNSNNTNGDANNGNTAADPNNANGQTDPNAGANTGGWVDPNAGGNTGGTVDPNAGGGAVVADPNAGNGGGETWVDPNAGGGGGETWVDPNAGAGGGGETWVDPNAGGGGGETWVDPNAGAGGGGEAVVGGEGGV
jgi:penicillin-binding protein 1A